MKVWAKASIALAMLALATAGWAWDPDEVTEYDAKAKEAIAAFKKCAAVKLPFTTDMLRGARAELARLGG